MNYSLKFGSYSFPSTFYPRSTPGNQRLLQQVIPRRAGVLTASAPIVGAKELTIEGFLEAADITSLRTKIDNLLTACCGSRQKLYLYDDRFTYATLSSHTIDYDDTSFKRYAYVSLNFIGDTGFWEAETSSSTSKDMTGQTDYTHTFAVGGLAPAYPIITARIDAGTGTPANLFHVKYTFNSNEVIELRVSGRATWLFYIQSELQTVTWVSDGADAIQYFSGLFPILKPNQNNSVRYQRLEGSHYNSTFSISWRNRWY